MDAGWMIHLVSTHFGRTELKIGVFKKEIDAEANFEVRFAVVHQKRGKNSKTDCSIQQFSLICCFQR